MFLFFKIDYDYLYVHADNHWGGIDMWASLRKKIDNEPIDALLHCGDQVGQGCEMWRLEYSVPDAATCAPQVYLDHEIRVKRIRQLIRKHTQAKVVNLELDSTIVNDIEAVNQLHFP